MKLVMAGVFGFSLGFMISVVSSYNLMNWQWWATFLPVAVIGVIYANTPRK